MRASGLRWRPGRLRHGERLLSFKVSYRWRACRHRRGRCRRAAESAATPFAASRYHVGHADTGRRLRLTETAAEVVRTGGAGFSFQIIRASASVTTVRAVRAFRRGRPPVSEFVNGLPERRTGYQQDKFVCSPGRHCQRKREFGTYCRQMYSPARGFAAVKFSADLDGRLFYPCPKGT